MAKVKVVKKEEAKEKASFSEHIGVLDGVRAFAIFMVVFYHYWQQSWISGFKIPGLEGTFFAEIPNRPFFADGSLFVEVFILLTGFCLFLPYAKSMFDNKVTLDSPGTFYKKRAVRLLPSIWLSLIVWVILFTRLSAYGSVNLMVKDIADNFFLLRGTMLFSHASTKFAAAGVLWTVTIEMFFYIIFPWIARLFKKWPVYTSIGMIVIGEAYTNMYALLKIENGETDYHRAFICYLGVFALGMLGAYAYHSIRNSEWIRNKYASWICTGISLVALYAALWMIWSFYDQHRGADMQAKIRLPLALCFAVFIVALCYSKKGLTVIFSNPVTRFLSKISLNIYIWHMFFALKFKEWRIPWYPDNTQNVSAWPQNGNFEGKLTWQLMYLLLCLAATIITATLVTYFVEKPVAKLFLKKKSKN